MGFWGLSKEGKEAKKMQGEIAKQNLAQSKVWTNRATGWGEVGDRIRDWGIGYYQNEANTRLPAVSESRAVGSEIMPGVDEALARRAQILGEMQGEIDRTYGRVGQREARTSRYVMGNIGDTYADLADRYDTQRATGAGAYGDALKDVETLAPMGDFASAQSARAWAGAKTAAGDRLRRAGVDPNSLEAQSTMQRVEASRARAMDDAIADRQQNYVTEKNDLRKQRLDYDTGMMREQAGLAETGAGLSRDEALRSANSRNANDLSRMQDTVTNWETAFNDTLTAPLVKQAEFDAGLNYYLTDLNARNQAAANLMRIGEGQYRNMFEGANMAQNYSNTANQQYGDIYNREKASAGWGLKLLGGIGGAALNAFTGGLAAPLTKGLTNWGSNLSGKIFGSAVPSYGSVRV